ncbi:MAG: YqgE/AlgH family protein [Alphaproteobacteria bacterium]
METSLKGKFLIAMPALDDPNFERSVIFICEHTPEGAMGFVINKDTPDISLTALFAQLKIPLSDAFLAKADHDIVRSGGPCHPSNGFVVFPNGSRTTDSEARDTPASEKEKIEIINDTYCFSSDLAFLRDIAAGEGPEKFVMVLGFAGWDAGQLEAELLENSWLHVDADEDLVYTTNLDTVWQRAVSKLGFEPSHLSSFSGRA